MFACFSFFLFSTQNQVPKVIIEMSRLIYHIKALSVLIRMKFKSFEICSVSRKTCL